MKKVQRQHTFCAALLLLGLISTAQAASITYDTDNRPTEFTGINIGGTLYDVTTTWDGSFNDAYGAGASFVPPLFWGDDAGADAAANAMRDALLSDGYSQIGLTSYLWVPVGPNFSFSATGPAVWLHNSGITISAANMFSSGLSTDFGTVGFTQFSVSAVPIPAAIWLFGSGLIGLARRKKA